LATIDIAEALRALAAADLQEAACIQRRANTPPFRG
jgi:hypothetical protein